MCCFYLLIWKHFAKEVCIIIFIYTFLFCPDHFFFIRSSADGLQIGVTVSFNYLPQSLLQPLYLITQGKQPSACSTPHSPICLHWWGIRCVRSPCGTGSFQQNCSVRSVFWRDFISLSSPKLLIPACHCNLSFLCGCYISLKPHLTSPLIQSVIPAEVASSKDSKSEITRRRLMDDNWPVLHFLAKRKFKRHIFALYPFLPLSLSMLYSPIEENLKGMKTLKSVEALPYVPVSFYQALCC